YDKKLSYAPLAPHLIEKTKLLILSGPTAEKIAAAVREHPDYHGSPEIAFVGGMEEAVKLADERAAAGDIVTLSPASASFDRYRNFELRGRHFKELVGGLNG
ncbi:MAG TPA: UDP-N-acetylmuramoyl-L-alanine--D-glutamate ligase, partial [Oscillospiraceae bacterium]|nr:UDP-N-acetylmuramoyl-L-alanine--D-glutamate ligase [Oscillospiraceae bacterium]